MDKLLYTWNVYMYEVIPDTETFYIKTGGCVAIDFRFP